MSDRLFQALAAYIPRDRLESLLFPGRELAGEGVALIGDLSGFTALTEMLAQGLRAGRGGEEMNRVLAQVFTPLAAEVHACGGSVIRYAGDAVLVWFGRGQGETPEACIRRALTSAWRMQETIGESGHVQTPLGEVTLRIKIGMSYGPIRRFNLGLPEHGYEDAFAGRTLDRMSEAERHAEPGEIVLERATAEAVSDALVISEWRGDYAILGRSPDLREVGAEQFSRRDSHAHLPEVDPSAQIQALRAYIPEQVYQVIARGRGHVAELKPVVSLFIEFRGLDYDGDADAGEKLQTYFATAQTLAAHYGGRLNRLITGDKGNLLHVIFGAPRAVEEQEQRAVQFALQWQKEGGSLPFIEMQRIGIAAGRVFAGPVGSADRHDYTTIGDAINLSARLMQHAEPRSDCHGRIVACASERRLPRRRPGQNPRQRQDGAYSGVCRDRRAQDGDGGRASGQCTHVWSGTGTGRVG